MQRHLTTKNKATKQKAIDKAAGAALAGFAQSDLQSQPWHCAPGGCGSPARWRKSNSRSSTEKCCTHRLIKGYAQVL
jgi:hypothetical protein